ncbi:c-type cytochrome domain-containing protein [Cyclobacterium marinum]|nr:c-type cytochrome domain-containing protein [Cyclobacterium marinum]
MDNKELPSTTNLWIQLAGKRIIIPSFFIISYLFMLLVPTNFDEQNHWFVFLGRFHPLVLHFPIVLILVTTGFLLMGFFNPNFNKPVIIRSLLWASVFFSFVSILAGYLLYISESYSGNLVSNHLNGALATGISISLCLIIYELNYQRKSKGSFVFYFLLIVANFSLAYTSHMGGSLTHGEDFLTAPLDALLPAKKIDKAPEDMLLFEDMIATIFETKCVSCHNENKTKGDLLLNNYEEVFAKGKSKKQAIIPGDTSNSELMVRVLLPDDHDERMPPEGKPGLTDEEISLLSYWISSGASDTLTYGDINDEKVLTEIEALMPDIRQAQYKIIKEKEAFEAALQELRQIGDPIGIDISIDERSNGKFFGLKMRFPPAHVNNDEIKAFSPYFPYFSRVSLASSNIDDDALFDLGKMSQLRRLILQKTNINGEGLPYLKDLENLEELNLSFTPLDEGNLLYLIGFKNLQKVYLFGTPVKPEVISALQKHKPELEIILEEGPFY